MTNRGARPDRLNPPRSPGRAVLRYGVPVVMLGAGIVLLVVSPAGLGVDGLALGVGGGLSVLLINFLFRLGVSGDAERQRQERARDFFDQHGRWPDEMPRESRTWTIPRGPVTPEREEGRDRRSDAGPRS